MIKQLDDGGDIYEKADTLEELVAHITGECGYTSREEFEKEYAVNLEDVVGKWFMTVEDRLYIKE